MQEDTLTNDQIELLIKNAINIITEPGGELDITETQRKLAVFFRNGVFVVMKNSRENPNIIMLREFIRRRGYQILKEFSAEDTIIRAIYNAKQLAG